MKNPYIVGCLFAMMLMPASLVAADFLSHPPMRHLPQPTQRPREKGPAYFVDAARGLDTNDGAENSPWKTATRAYDTLKAGDTLYLRGGTYYENLYLSLVGKPDAPITIRSFPGELAIIDGGLREFFEAPKTAWEPCPGGAADEYRSVRRYPNLRNVLGFFGDSMVPLQAYYHRKDLAAASEERVVKEGQSQAEPYYIGPGVWYDPEGGYVHARLAHTHQNVDYPDMANYEGTTDPRQVPLVIAPFRAAPIFVDAARHIRFQDLVVRGGGFDTVVLQGAQHVEFDNVVVYCGAYGIRGRYSGHVRFQNSALRGAIAPWGALEDCAMREFPGWPIPSGRNMARLNSHALVVMEGHTEEQLHYLPLNHDWEFSYSDFTDGHDGLYFGGERIRFHHNLLARMQDDYTYISPLTRFDLGDLFIYQNHFTGGGRISFGFGGLVEAGRLEGKLGARFISNGAVYVFRNIVDLRQGIPMGHSPQKTPPQIGYGSHVVGHSPPEAIPALGSLFIYQNTLISSHGLKQALSQDPKRSYAQGTLVYTAANQQRRVFNNLFVHIPGMQPMTPETLPSPEEDVQIDGNLHWDLTAAQPADPNFFAAYRASPLFAESKKRYEPGWEANAVVADPQFLSFDPKPPAKNDYRLKTDSPAKGAGIVLPDKLEDPLRPAGQARPDIGAIPVSAEAWTFGRDPARVPGSK